MSDERLSIPPDPKTLAYLLSEFRREQKATGEHLGNISTALGSIQTEIGHIKEAHRELGARVDTVEAEQAKCNVGIQIRGLNARVKNLEYHDRNDLKERLEDATGSIDLQKQRAEAEAMAAAAMASTPPKRQSPGAWAVFLTPKVLLTLVLAVIIGIALGAVVIAKALGYVSVPGSKDFGGTSGDASDARLQQNKMDPYPSMPPAEGVEHATGYYITSLYQKS